ncbi:hypothetical protein [Paenibacillus sp. OAE614]|uniref:hypothetical protein n=1 Tax=Paenibacillus sp. OAE614 TaxID=2663804 RepID=UPI0017898986
MEEEFYMVDLPSLLQKKAQQIAEDRLAQLQISIAPNMEEKAFKELVENFARPLETDQADDEEFDGAALAALRLRIEGR